MAKTKNKLSRAELVKSISEVCEMTPRESRLVSRVLLLNWKQKSDFENEVSEALEIVREEMKSGDVEEETKD